MSALETMGSQSPSSVQNVATAFDVQEKPAVERPSLRDIVTKTMEKYFTDMDGHPIANVYDMVLARVETPLLTSMMRFTRGNQSKAAILLGLSRGTLRKKLKIYDLEHIHLGEAKELPKDHHVFSLSDIVEVSVNNYLSKMRGQPIADVHEMVVSEVEEPLLLSMMKFTRGNQSRAAVLFGLSRGTLRKKLKKYGLD